MFKKVLAVAAAAVAVGLVVPNLQSAQAAQPPADCTSGDAVDPNNLSLAVLTSDNRVICIRQKAVKVGKGVAITGYTGNDTALVGIDYRVQDGLLYGVGNAGGVYTLDTATGVLTSVGSVSIALDGTLFGVDFNPAANALRIVSNTGQNLRVPFATGVPGTAVADTVLNTGGAAPVTVTGVLGAAYTNNDLLTPTATTLFDLSTSGSPDSIAIQSTANSGVVVNTGLLGTDVTDGDLDVYTDSAGDNHALAILVTGSGSQLTGIDLLGGDVAAPGRAVELAVDLALPINQ